jgi:hypothetical protein
MTELDDINELMDWEAIEHLIDDIHAKRRGNSATRALGTQSSERSGF